MNSQSLELLDPSLIRWMHKKGWQSLLPIQDLAVRPILEAKSDVIISASTASGKTEAAFLPTITAIHKNPEKTGIRILYISPLKALINDQCRRLEQMCEFSSDNVTPWHGDVSASKKKNLKNAPSGIVLTTPESLESMLINHVQWIKESMRDLSYVVIDEFHAFMGTQRGYQLQSQLHRLENLIGKLVPRIALSATFSDTTSVSSYLRPNSKVPCRIITAPKGSEDTLSVQIKGYDKPFEQDAFFKDNQSDDDSLSDKLQETTVEQSAEFEENAYSKISDDIFRLLRGKNNLVFCNSRSATEEIAAKLEMKCSENFVPNEFFPHHGSLSKELRESLEYRLQEGRWPTTAICTATLELGIDISDVNSIGQVDHPISVASLRQRLGRAGRRDHKAVLRVFLPEGEDNPNHEELYEDTVMTVAMIELLLERWYEPPLSHEYSFSTLLQQTLSVIASFGSASAKSLYELLCQTGPFSLCTPKVFGAFLRSLGENDLIVQLNDGSLTLGLKGESLVSEWSFYAAFDTPQEYLIEHDGHIIGSVPLNYELEVDSTFLFAGRGWRVVFFSAKRHVISVKPYQYDTQPLTVNGVSGKIYDIIRERMRDIYLNKNVSAYLNKKAKEHLQRGIDLFNQFKLDKRHYYEGAKGISLFPWKGDRVMQTIVLLLRKENIKASLYKSHIELEFVPMDSLKVAVHNLINNLEIKPVDLVKKIRHLDRDKHDEFISLELKQMAYAHSELDLQGAMDFLRVLKKELI